jgi:hypothetical protein
MIVLESAVSVAVIAFSIDRGTNGFLSSSVIVGSLATCFL